MENRAYALWTGVFTLCLAALIGGALWWFSSGGRSTADYLIISSRSVTGLNPQAQVRFRGVRVGKVAQVDLLDSREVHIRIRIDADVPVSRGTRARISIQGLTGQGFVQLDDDGSNPLPPEEPIPGAPPVIGMQPGLLDQATEAGQEILGRLRTTTERIERILNNDNLGRIDDTLRHLATSSAHLEKTLAQTAALSADMRRFSSPDNAQRLSSTLENFQRASQNLEPAVADFRKALAKVEAASGRIDKLGADLQGRMAGDTLPRVNQLVQDLQTNSQQLNRLLDDLERSPQQLLLGKQTGVPGPGELSPASP